MSEVLKDSHGRVLAAPGTDGLYHCPKCPYETHDHMSMLEHFWQHGIEVDLVDRGGKK